MSASSSSSSDSDEPNSRPNNNKINSNRRVLPPRPVQLGKYSAPLVGDNDNNDNDEASRVKLLGFTEDTTRRRQVSISSCSSDGSLQQVLAAKSKKRKQSIALRQEKRRQKEDKQRQKQLLKSANKAEGRSVSSSSSSSSSDDVDDVCSSLSDASDVGGINNNKAAVPARGGRNTTTTAKQRDGQHPRRIATALPPDAEDMVVAPQQNQQNQDQSQQNEQGLPTFEPGKAKPSDFFKKQVPLSELYRASLPSSSSATPVAIVTAIIKPDVIVLDALEGAPVLDVGSELVVASCMNVNDDGDHGDEAQQQFLTLGTIVSQLGNVQRCSYVVKVALLTQILGALKESNQLDGFLKVDATKCYAHRPSMIIVEDLETIIEHSKIKATDASFQDDVELPENVTPDFSDDEEERAYRAQKRDDRRQRKLLGGGANVAASNDDDGDADFLDDDDDELSDEYEFNEEGAIIGHHQREKRQKPSSFIGLNFKQQQQQQQQVVPRISGTRRNASAPILPTPGQQQQQPQQQDVQPRVQIKRYVPPKADE